MEIIWDEREEDNVACLFQPSEGLIAVPFMFTGNENLFIQAKMPNKQGAVPSGGSY